MDNAELLEKFGHFTKRHQLFIPSDRTLLAVSGGMDSMFMTWLFNACDFNFAMAHCNFMLRGEESQADERFVVDFAATLGVPVFTRQFDTLAYAESNHLSVQMAARSLRYAWFADLVRDHGFKGIALGHHLGDSTETMFINLLRGTGIAGLRGIRVKRGIYLRPLLFLTRPEIAASVLANNIAYREDSSNTALRYLRNFLRQEVIPLLKQRNKNLDHTFQDTSTRLGTVERLFNQKAAEIKSRIVSRHGKQDLSFSLPELGAIKEDAATLLYEWLETSGFTFGTCEMIALNLEAPPGTRYTSPTHEILFDRTYFLLRKTPQSTVETTQSMRSLFSLQLVDESLYSQVNFEKRSSENQPWKVILNAQELSFPLTFRYWQNGDTIRPSGMAGHKKLSDLFIDLKIPGDQKSKIPLVLSGDNIVWVAGLRLDDRYRYVKGCKWVLLLDYKPLNY